MIMLYVAGDSYERNRSAAGNDVEVKRGLAKGGERRSLREGEVGYFWLRVIERRLLRCQEDIRFIMSDWNYLHTIHYYVGKCF